MKICDAMLPVICSSVLGQTRLQTLYGDDEYKDKDNYKRKDKETSSKENVLILYTGLNSLKSLMAHDTNCPIEEKYRRSSKTNVLMYIGFRALWLMIPTKTKCLKDTTYAISSKSRGSKDIKYDIQTRPEFILADLILELAFLLSVSYNCFKMTQTFIKCLRHLTDICQIKSFLWRIFVLYFQACSFDSPRQEIGAEEGGERSKRELRKKRTSLFC